MTVNLTIQMQDDDRNREYLLISWMRLLEKVDRYCSHLNVDFTVAPEFVKKVGTK